MDATLALRGSSIMQPALASTNTTDHFLAPGTAIQTASITRGGALHPWESLTSESFWKKQAEQVRPDEVFFHKYFSVTGPRKEAKSKKKGSKKSAEEDVDDIVDGDEFEDDGAVGNEDEIWKALVGSAPELEGVDGDEDGEDGFESEDLEGYRDDDSDVDGDMDGGVDIEGSEEEEMPEGDDEEVDIEDGVDLDLDMGIGDEGSDIVGTDEEEEDVAEMATKIDKRKKKKSQKDEKGTEDTGKRKRRRLRDLPTFAPAEDYEEALGGNDDEDV